MTEQGRLCMPAEQRDEQVFETVKNIWSTILSMDVTRSRQAVSSYTQSDTDRYITACVQLTGAWEGSVLVYTTRQLARQMAAIMFDMEADQLSEDDIDDAMGELGNITAGNLKLILPKVCELSLPTVVDGCDYRLEVPGSKVRTKLLLSCCEQPLTVSLLEKASDDDEVSAAA
jgi:chemotaxis protein CheX